MTPLARLDVRLRDRSLLLRVLLSALAIVAMVAVVQGWSAPFPFRLGEIADHGITAKVAFQKVDRAETDRMIADAEARVPNFFQHDPEPLEELPARLRSALGEVAQAPSLEELSPETRAAFGLTLGDHIQNSDKVGQEFAALKAAVSKEEGTTGNRIDDLIAEFEQFIAPLERHGLADPNELNDLLKHDLRANRPVVVISKNSPQTPYTIAQNDVRLSELLKETGLLGKSWQRFPELFTLRQMLERWLLSQAPPTLRFDGELTKQARRDARQRIEDNPVTLNYNRGDVLVAPGEVIDAEALAILRAEHRRLEQLVPAGQRIARVITVVLMMSVLLLLYGYYLVHYEKQLLKSASRFATYLGVLVAAAGLGRILALDYWGAEVVPLMATVMVFAIAYNQVLATLTAFTLTLIISFSTGGDLGQFVVLMSVATTSAVLLARVPSRSTVIKVGIWAAAAYFVVSWGTGIIQSQAVSEVWSDTNLLLRSLRGAGWCLVSGFLVAGSLPFIEAAFGVVTDISLLELSAISHPLLQELVRRAPGTYNHSMTVASIGEAAADRIGANGLLVRVGAYFHDIGKMLKPHYFVENMSEGAVSRHANLAPAMSTLIIIGHVKDGVDLARQHNLPQQIIDFIEQHHGTTLVAFFYHQARQAGQQPDHKTDVEESLFRYPGPKPQSREAGVLMIADAVEGASRTLSDPTPKRIESLVHEITMQRLLDGQFDDSSLTMMEISAVEDSLTKSLIGIYHGRIKYPEQRTA
jgi:putative nucleotidyltransferase with HDIG domain